MTAISPGFSGSRPSSGTFGLIDGSTFETTMAGAPPSDSTTVAVDHELPGGLDLALGVLDAVHLGDLPDGGLGQRGQRVLEGVELGRARDDDVDLGVAGREDVVERGVDLVGQDEGARHHRDAEHDRDRRQDGAELAGHEPAEDQPDHACSRPFTTS